MNRTSPRALYSRAAHRLSLATLREPHPADAPWTSHYPRGWFAACTAAELHKKGELRRTLLGQELKLSLSLDGHALARTLDGRTLPAEFYYELFMIWNDGGLEEEPAFELPYLLRPDFSPFAFRYFERPVRASVKDIVETLADIHHFRVEGRRFSNVSVRRFDTRDARLHLELKFERRSRILPLLRRVQLFEAEIQAVGLGFYSAEFRLHPGLVIQLLFCFTPTESPNQVQLLIGESHSRVTNAHAIQPGLELLPERWLDALLSWDCLRGALRDLRTLDVPHWENPVYLETRHHTSDAFLDTFRRWAQQFYT
jgi:hypothetical protein